jgi:arsenate reductase
MRTAPWREPAAEAVGTALLLWVIVGSGIAVDGDGPLISQLVPHAIAIGLVLALIIATLGPVSGAHLNPVVTLAAVLVGNLPRTRALAYVGAQVLGGVLGVMAANLMFRLPVVTVSGRGRDGAALIVSEVGATLGLVMLILLMVHAGRQVRAIAAAVGAYIGVAIVLTPSTAFANPAVTVARTLSDTFAGIAPASVPAFVVAQTLGALLAVGLFRSARRAARR